MVCNIYFFLLLCHNHVEQSFHFETPVRALITPVVIPLEQQWALVAIGYLQYTQPDC